MQIKLNILSLSQNKVDSCVAQRSFFFRTALIFKLRTISCDLCALYSKVILWCKLNEKLQANIY